MLKQRKIFYKFSSLSKQTRIQRTKNDHEAMENTASLECLNKENDLNTEITNPSIFFLVFYPFLGSLGFLVVGISSYLSVNIITYNKRFESDRPKVVVLKIKIV
jgi:hypothetical protein